MINFLETRAIRKVFGTHAANDSIDLQIQKGEIHGIVGENGAGKSTLMKILCGAIKPDRGEILVNNQPVNFKSANDALKYGIAMVYQHFMLVDSFSVLENIILGSEPQRNLQIDCAQAEQKISDWTKFLDCQVKIDEPTENITVGEKQRVEILKVLFRNADCLILDEPTAVLAPQEVDRFLELLLKLKAAGKAIILISHKLREILKVCDRITVLRAGKSVARFHKSEVNLDSLVHAMVGRDLKPIHSMRSKDKLLPLEPILAIQDLKNKKDHKIFAGEIVGIAGLEGQGQRNFVENIVGLKYSSRWRVTLTDRSQNRNGFAFVPEDRIEGGLVTSMKIWENFYLGSRSQNPHFFSLRKSALKDQALQAQKDFDIKWQNLDQKVQSLSGGNQQKLLLAREISLKPSLLVASQPTRGVDLGAIETIHQKLLHERDGGLSILLVSSELDELLSLSDRIWVMRGGEIVKEFADLSGGGEELRYQIGETMLCRD